MPRSCRRSRPEDNTLQDAVAVEHGGDAVLEGHGDGLARVRPADGALVAAELDIAAPVEATRFGPGEWMSSREYSGRKRGRQTAARLNGVRDTRSRHMNNTVHSPGVSPE